MLSRTGYTQATIDDARRLVDDQLAAYDALVAATTTPAGGTALATFEPRYLASVVLVLDQLFVHRARAAEGKDGNPCNEVRLIGRALTEEGGVMPADKQIRLDPARTITGLGPGAAVVLTREAVGELVDGYFAEIRTRFAAPEAASV